MAADLFWQAPVLDIVASPVHLLVRGFGFRDLGFLRVEGFEMEHTSIIFTFRRVQGSGFTCWWLLGHEGRDNKLEMILT